MLAEFVEGSMTAEAYETVVRRPSTGRRVLGGAAPIRVLLRYTLLLVERPKLLING